MSLFGAYVFEGFCEYTVSLIGIFVVITKKCLWIKTTSSLCACFHMHTWTSVCWHFVDILHAFLNVCLCVQACASPHTWEWVIFSSASPAPNHLSQRGHHVLKPIISFQQLLGSSLCFPTMGPARQIHIHTQTKTTSATCSYQQAHADTRKTVTQTLALKSVKAFFLIGGNVAFITVPNSHLFGGSQSLWLVAALTWIALW